MNIKCVNKNSLAFLTEGLVYEVLDEADLSYLITDDLGYEGWHDKWMFDIVYPDDTIQVICVNRGCYTYLTENLVYDVIEEDDDYYYIINDFGLGEWYEKTLFKKPGEENNTNKLTFKEVINNIKDKEIWEGEGEDIIGLPNGKFKIIWHEGIKYTIDPNNVYQLKVRTKVSFAEALAAYNNYKEIESHINGHKYKQVGGGTQYRYTELYGWCRADDCSIPIKEMQGEWYINE